MKKVFSTRLSDDAHLAIKAAMRLYNLSKAEALCKIMAEGIKNLMSEYNLVFIDTQEYMNIEPADRHFNQFWKLADAIMYGDSASYYFATVPDGGYWKKQGHAGKRTILHRARALTKNGLNDNLEIAEQLPEIPEWLSEVE